MDNEKMIDVSKEIESLVAKAEKAATAVEALQYSQAASNAANAMACTWSVQAGMGKTGKNNATIDYVSEAVAKERERIRGLIG